MAWGRALVFKARTVGLLGVGMAAQRHENGLCSARLGQPEKGCSAACHGQVGNQPDFFVVQVVVFGLLLDKLGDLVFQAAYVVLIGAQVVGDAAK